MNERFKELAKQAAVATNEDPNGEYPAHMMGKFAELLLTNVLEIVKNATPNPGLYDDDYDTRAAAQHTANFIRDEIKREFRVK